MSSRCVHLLSRACLGLILLAGCADDDAGTGGAGGLEPCTEDTCSGGNGGSTPSSSGASDGGGDAASTSTGDGGAPSGPTTDTSSGTSTSTGEGAGGGGEGGNGAGGDPGDGALVVNELSAAGDDWIELYNAGDADLDVGGLRIADQLEPGVPKLEEAIEIPAGTTLSAGEYLFILADQDVASDGFVAECGPGPAPCLVSAFGLSVGGDEIFVIDEVDAIVLSVEYPADATVAGESWGRLPNGTGAFAVNAPTPGEANEDP